MFAATTAPSVSHLNELVSKVCPVLHWHLVMDPFSVHERLKAPWSHVKEISQTAAGPASLGNDVVQLVANTAPVPVDELLVAPAAPSLPALDELDEEPHEAASRTEAMGASSR